MRELEIPQEVTNTRGPFSSSSHISAFQWRGTQGQAFNNAANSIPNLHRCQVRAHWAPRSGCSEAVKTLLNPTHAVYLRNPSWSPWELGRLPWKSPGKLKKASAWNFTELGSPVFARKAQAPMLFILSHGNQRGLWYVRQKKMGWSVRAVATQDRHQRRQLTHGSR